VLIELDPRRLLEQWDEADIEPLSAEESSAAPLRQVIVFVTLRKDNNDFNRRSMHGIEWKLAKHSCIENEHCRDSVYTRVHTLHY